MLKIVTPLSNIDCYEPLADAGADEFFCGFIPHEWLTKYGVIMPINRREFLLDNCNICSFSSMEILSKKVKKYKKPVKITFNSQYYIPKQYPLLLSTIERLIELGFSTFIIADPSLIIYLRDHKVDCQIHLSGECCVLNSLALKFFNQLNINRYVYPAKTTLGELEETITKARLRKSIEHEAFILNDWCTYLGAYCNTIHCDEMPNTCHLPYYVSKINEDLSPKAQKNFQDTRA